MRAIGLSLLLLAVAACQPSAGLPAANASPEALVVRLLTNAGGRIELWTTLRPGETVPAPATPTPRATPARTPTAKPTPSAKATPTPRPSPTRVPPTPSPTPRVGPNVPAMVEAFKRVGRYRARVSGPFELVQEVDRGRLHDFLSAPSEAELIVEGTNVFARSGKVWVRVRNPPRELLFRVDSQVQLMAGTSHTYAPLGVYRAREGRCNDWEVLDAATSEPYQVCVGISNNLPYRMLSYGGIVIEFYDYGGAITVPEPSPRAD